MKRFFIKKRIWKNKRGFTLVELMVAILLMGVISASLSTILFSTFKLYNNAEMTSLLYNVNQKLHIAINDELSSCKDMLIFNNGKTGAPTNASIVEEYQARLYLDSYGHIVRYTKKNGTEHILLSENSYQGASVTSFSIKYDYIYERVSYDQDTLKNCYRILYITTVISKNGVNYESSSTVRLYNMALWGTEVYYVHENGSTRIANRSGRDVEYNAASYYYTQYYDQLA